MKRITLLLIIVSLSSNCLFSQSNLKGKFNVVFEKAKSLYPLDSVSLRRFYFEWFPAKSDEDLKKQITQLENLTSQETVKRYKEVNVKLKPLLASIIKINSLNKNQAESLKEQAVTKEL